LQHWLHRGHHTHLHRHGCRGEELRDHALRDESSVRHGLGCVAGPLVAVLVASPAPADSMVL
jgi:hypothetical protein